MANYRAIVSVGESLVTYLRNAYPTELRAEIPRDFRLVSSNELNAPGLDFGTALTLYLHRVTIDSNLRNSSTPVGALSSHTPVSLNLHYLLTIWADSAANEQAILGWAIRELYQHEALSQSDLTPAGGWSPEMPAAWQPLAETMTPIVQEILRSAGRRGTIDPETAARMMEQLRASGRPRHELPHETFTAVTRVLDELGANVVPALLAAMHQTEGEPPPEVRELIRRLGEGLRVPDAGTTEDILARMTDKPVKPTS